MSENNKTVYPYSVDHARQNGELDQWRESGKLNTDCARAIDQAVRDSNYELYHYDLPGAAKSVIAEYGADRVNFVLAAIIQRQHYDGRFSRSNKEWAREFDIPTNDRHPVCDTHLAILDGFVNRVREVAAELEKQNPLAAAEMSKEQNYNMIDGIPNNESSPKADLTDGQTFEEIRELAPEMLPEEKTSVLAQLREARETARCDAPAPHPQKGEPER